MHIQKIEGTTVSVTILGPLLTGGALLPLFSSTVSAGFPSPAADHIEKRISLDELLEIRAPHVYVVRIHGDSMVGAGIFDGDLAIVDRSITPRDQQIVIAAVDNEPACKRLNISDTGVFLSSENDQFSPRHLLDGEELVVWGVVKYSVRAHAPRG